MTWKDLAKMSPDEIRSKGLFPIGFLPLPHPYQQEGGMVFPQFHIDEILDQAHRDLTRFDVDFDLPDQFLPEFPAPIFLTTRPDLGDVSKGELVTHQNYFRLFNGVLNPKQLEGLRLLVTPFPQQQFNLTDDRRSPAYYTDNLMHDLRTEQFFEPQDVNGRLAMADGPIKTFPLRGIKDSPSYLHDGRLLTLDDTVEFFNLVLGLELTDTEKQNLVAFMLTL